MNTLEASARTMQYVLELVGVVAFSVSGAVAGIRHRLDWFGVVILGFVVAVGGGTLRDMVLAQPAWWLTEPWQVLLALLTGALVLVLAHRHRERLLDTWEVVLVADAAGLAVFGVLGADAALAAGAHAWAAVAMAVVTGTGGGVLRDVLVNKPPLLLTGQIYALAVALGATVHVALLQAGADVALASWSAILVTLLLRLLAMRHDWNLPTVPDPGAS